MLDQTDSAGPSDERVGTVVSGKYRIDAVLGRGGMGVVLSGWHLQLDQRVALKFMHRRGGELGLRRFRREARAAARITSEHVARVTDVGMDDDGACYIVMEHLSGSDLHAVLRERGSLPVDEAVELVLQACDAIAEAHDKGIIHRDLKPSNLFLTRRPGGASSLKVLDFGIAKMAEEAPSDATNTNDVVGSNFYMSPEQLLGAKSVSAATDIWALGAVLYELLSGERPFVGETIPAVHVAISTRPARPLTELRPDIPEALEAIVDACLKKAPAARPPTVAALAQRLLPFCTRPTSAVIVERIANMKAWPGAERTWDRPFDAADSQRATDVTVVAPRPRSRAPAIDEPSTGAPVSSGYGRHSVEPADQAPTTTQGPPPLPLARRRWVLAAAPVVFLGVLTVGWSLRSRAVDVGGVGATTLAPLASIEPSTARPTAAPGGAYGEADAGVAPALVAASGHDGGDPQTPGPAGVARDPAKVAPPDREPRAPSTSRSVDATAAAKPTPTAVVPQAKPSDSEASDPFFFPAVRR